jgi:hypothetical protein
VRRAVLEVKRDSRGLPTIEVLVCGHELPIKRLAKSKVSRNCVECGPGRTNAEAIRKAFRGFTNPEANGEGIE